MTYFDDFRKEIIADYLVKKNKVITSDGPKYANYRVIFDGKYYSKDKCLIMNRGDISIGAMSNLLYHQGYTIDDIGLTKSITDNKMLLFSLLKEQKYPVPEMFLGLRSTGKSSIRFNHHDDIDIGLSSEESMSNPFGVFSWASPELVGYVYYYYFNKLVSKCRMLRTSNKIYLKSMNAKQNYTSMTPLTYGTFNYTPTQEIAKEEKDALDSIEPLSLDLESKIRNIPSMLSSTSCQVIVGFNLGVPIIVNIHQTHKPYCQAALGKEVFFKEVKDIFYEKIEEGD
jgi:hypothetical protein